MIEINQENLYLLLPSKVCWMADMLTDATGESVIAALAQIYSSTTYKNLEREETKMWHLGPVDLYRDMVDGSASR